MLWYQRPPGDTAMKLIGYLYMKDPTVERPFQKHFSLSGDLSGNTQKNSSLVMQNLNAVHYCAAREAWQRKSPLIATKTLIEPL